MNEFRAPEIRLETIWRTVLVTDARNSSKAYFSEKAEEALVRIERDRSIFHDIAARHGGEEVRDRGDGSMFAFCDPVEAIQAAMAMQMEIAGINLELKPGELRLVHRMGVQMGEIKVVLTEDASGAVHRKLSGDMVVTAARLEGIAHPGEVCFTNDVYKAIRGKIAHDFRCLDSTLKGFDRPVRVWSTRIDREWERPLTAEEEAGKARRKEETRLREKWEREQRDRNRRRTLMRFAGMAAIAAVGFAGARWAVANGDLRRFEEGASALVLKRVPERSGKAVSFQKDAQRTDVSSGVTRRPKPVAKRAKRPAKKPPTLADLRPQVVAIVAERLPSGDFDGIAQALEDRDLSVRFSDVYGSAMNVQSVKNWLVTRFTDDANGGEVPIVELPIPIDGMTQVTGVDEGGIVGKDATGSPKNIEFGDLKGDDLGRIVEASIPPDGSNRPPVLPDRCVQDLRRLRNLSR